MVLLPEFKEEILPFAKLALDLGVDYGVIKHCSDDEFGTLGVDYSKYEEMYSLLNQAESMEMKKLRLLLSGAKSKTKAFHHITDFMAHNFYYKSVGVD